MKKKDNYYKSIEKKLQKQIKKLTEELSLKQSNEFELMKIEATKIEFENNNEI